MMNRAAKVVLGVYPSDSSSSSSLSSSSSSFRLFKLHWLPVHYRILYKIALITYKIRFCSSPTYLHQLLHNRTIQRPLRSSTAPELARTKANSNIGARSFRHASPIVWNALPAEIRNCGSVASFKTKLKTFYFKLAFERCNF